MRRNHRRFQDRLGTRLRQVEDGDGVNRVSSGCSTTAEVSGLEFCRTARRFRVEPASSFVHQQEASLHMHLWLFVAARIIANPISNVFQKKLTQRRASPIFIIAATFGLLAITVAPLFLLPIALEVDPLFWPNIIACDVLAVAQCVDRGRSRAERPIGSGPDQCL